MVKGQGETFHNNVALKIKFLEKEKTEMFKFIAFNYEREYWYEHRNSSIESVSICRAQKSDIDR